MPKRLVWFFFVVLTFIVSLPATWWIQAKFDFFYPTLYELVGIDDHIQRYAPINLKLKTGFELTLNEERFELFHGIVESIHNHGDGLKALSYNNQFTQTTTPLLTEAEVIHLQDVANLLDTLKPVVVVLFILWLLLMALQFKRRQVFPSMQFVLLSFLVILALSGLVLSFGPEKVFNQLHEWVFPDEHQWFFYYEESLMSTMMKAPYLFAYIAAIWACLSVFFSFIVLGFFRHVSIKRSASNSRVNS